MVKSLPGIFAGGDGGVQAFFCDGHPEIERRGVGSGETGVETQVEGTFVRIGRGRGCEEQARLGMRSGRVDLFDGFLVVAADKLGVAVHDQLRCVHTALGNFGGVVLLTKGEVRG